MLDYLEKLRKKPEAERRKSVFRISLTITLVIASFWVGSLFLKKQTSSISNNADSTLKQTVPSLKETFSNFFDSVGKVFDNNEVVENTNAFIEEIHDSIEASNEETIQEISTSTEETMVPGEEIFPGNVQ